MVRHDCANCLDVGCKASKRNVCDPVANDVDARNEIYPIAFVLHGHCHGYTFPPCNRRQTSCSLRPQVAVVCGVSTAFATAGR